MKMKLVLSRDVPSLQRDVSWEIKMLEERRQARRNINDARLVQDLERGNEGGLTNVKLFLKAFSYSK